VEATSLRRELNDQYRLITLDSRLDRIAEDVVTHLVGLNRGTKGMVVGIDKLTAVRMWEKVKAAWGRRLKRVESEPYGDERQARERLEMLTYMRETDMAVVISQSQDEVEFFKKKGIDITPHRKRVKKEDLDTRFKDDKDPLRLVFVCAMWMTGFDVPSCGVVYLDKPMKNHSLMQTIARANRVFEGKENGLIVDYIGVFKDLNRALAIYGAGSGGGVRPGDRPIQPKEEQLAELRAVLGTALEFCSERGVDLEMAKADKRLTRLNGIKNAIDKLIAPADVQRRFLELADRVDRLYRALGVDEGKNALSADWGALVDIAKGMRGLERSVDISELVERIDSLLDASIDGVPPSSLGERVQLGAFDFARLAAFFAATKRKTTAANALAGSLRNRVAALVWLNPKRAGLRELLDGLIAEYNESAKSVDEFFQQLLAFIKKIEAEEARGDAEKLTEEQLAIYDLLIIPHVPLDAAGREAIKSLARELSARIEKKLVIDWRKSQMKRAAVRVAIKQVLRDLPDAYSDEAFERLLEQVYEHVYESYWGDGRSKYTEGCR